LVVLSGCDSIPTAPEPGDERLLFAQGTADHERPFRGRIQGRFVASLSADPTIYVGGAQATGQGTHVGAFRKVTTDVTNMATSEVNATFTMTVANGDHLIGTYSGFLSFGPVPGTVTWVLDAEITGGTGRFAHASGSFVFRAEGHYVTVDGVVHGDYTETFDGFITY
jgi:hypothetical protein